MKVLKDQDWIVEFTDQEDRLIDLLEDKLICREDSPIYRKYKGKLKDQYCFRIKEFTDWIVEVTDQEDKAEFCWSD